ncbi:unnamed protein product [Hermetia illucens]|uniref:Coiled-coil domain-containing protein 39 n=2 Tax=Hermetia illucens TaxID=343691 RepID=A0A7R8V5Q3_HERIL|nr:unnamed protein product [Hermetia illucens]
MDNNDILIKIHKELTDQKQKIQRAERELKAAHKVARQRCCEGDNFVQFERELDLRELEEKNTTGLQLLADLVEMSPDLAPVVSTLLYEKGMKIPQVKRVKHMSSYQSDYSERTIRSVSQASLEIFSASSRASVSTISTSSKSVLRRCAIGSAQPSVVSLEFPVFSGKLCSEKSAGSTKKYL